MRNIDVKIARSEAEWRRYRYRNTGVRESLKQFLGASVRSARKRINCAFRNMSRATGGIRFKPSYDERRENIVVSLTSTPGRIKGILPTLRSLAAQTKKPDLIILWLDKGGVYPGRIISRISETGILIKYRKDLGPNTKYYYAFREYKDDLVITVDDDIIYHKDMVRELYGTYLKHPGTVVARRVHKMRFDRNRELLGYKDWIWEYGDFDRPSHDLFATGTGGVLYPPAVMGLRCWESTDFRKVCPKADDIWLKFSELKNGIRVCAVKNAGFRKDSVNLRTLNTSLAAGNIGKGRNDTYIRACAGYFGMKDDLCERVLGE